MKQGAHTNGYDLTAVVKEWIWRKSWDWTCSGDTGIRLVPFDIFLDHIAWSTILRPFCLCSLLSGFWGKRTEMKSINNLVKKRKEWQNTNLIQQEQMLPHQRVACPSPLSHALILRIQSNLLIIYKLKNQKRAIAIKLSAKIYNRKWLLTDIRALLLYIYKVFERLFHISI